MVTDRKNVKLLSLKLFAFQLEGGLDSNNPLDGVDTIADKGATMFQYYLKIVPTLYSRTDSLFATNQFSVTRHSKGIKILKPKLLVVI